MKLHALPPSCILGLLVACADVPPAERATPTVLAFTDVTEAAGLGAFQHVTGAYGDHLFPETMGSGVSFIDYDGDGWPDLLVVGGANWPGHGESVQALYLFRNQGDGTFVDVSAEVGLDAVQAYGFGLAVADIDLDGDEDFYFTTVYENYLFRNDEAPDMPPPHRRFTDVTATAGVDGGRRWSTSAAFFHADSDPYPDLYVDNYVPWTPETDKFCSAADGVSKGYCTPLAYVGIPGTFYRNNGDGTFTESTDIAGFGGSPGKSLGVLPLDYDRDGHTDLMVTNDAVRDLLYHNKGDGTFTEVGLFAGVAFDERGRARAGMGIDAGVVDTSGQVTIFIGNFSNETLGVYRYAGNGTFEERAAASKLARPSTPTLTFGLGLFDADLDGNLDLFAANGHVQDDIDETGTGITYRQSAHLFLNDGNGQFRDVIPQMDIELGMAMVARGAAWADYDGDGDVDLVVTDNGARLRLFRNDSSGGGFIQIHPISDAGVTALDAHVDLYTASGHQHRFVRTAHSYLSASDAVLTFGLGSDEAIDSVVVGWRGGMREVWTDLQSGRRYRLIQGTSGAGAHAAIVDSQPD